MKCRPAFKDPPSTNRREHARNACNICALQIGLQGVPVRLNLPRERFKAPECRRFYHSDSMILKEWVDGLNVKRLLSLVHSNSDVSTSPRVSV